jgi:hypothetical protein
LATISAAIILVASAIVVPLSIRLGRPSRCRGGRNFLLATHSRYTTFTDAFEL